MAWLEDGDFMFNYALIIAKETCSKGWNIDYFFT
jgi:hypothetical protein